MCRKKIRFYHSLLFQISLWILLLGIGSIGAVSYFVEMQMRHNMEKRMKEELLRIQENGELYVCQILMLHNSQINEKGFRQYVHEMEEQFQSAGYGEVAFYSAEGQMLGGSYRDRFEAGEEREDFQLAQKGESAFTLRYGNRNQCDVYFTMPVEIGGRKLGMISYYLDYSDMYGREWNAFREMIHIIILVFCLLFLIIWLMMRRILSPVRKLSGVTSDISRHLADGHLDSEALEEFKIDRRRDEIGELAGNYVQLLHVTEEQFGRIQGDRERILQLLDSRQEFYNSVTHELKTPLTTISGYAQLIRDNGLEDEVLFHNGMEQILRESTRLHQMVVQLLEMQDSGGEMQMKPVDAAAVLKSAVDAMGIKAERYGNRLALDVGEGIYLVKGQESRMYQVFINLIDNAIKYGTPQKDISICALAERDWIRIAVENEGRGIGEEELEQIFDPFFRIDREESRELGSAGLGLAISRKIVEQHGGSIWAESELGGKTVFTVAFPRVSSAEGAAGTERS